MEGEGDLPGLGAGGKEEEEGVKGTDMLLYSHEILYYYTTEARENERAAID